MRSVGTICEFNPLHNGHGRLLRAMRENAGDDGCVVCVMSGRFVQRGEAAVADPYLRAETALTAGADLVVELPFPWSCGSAERFADAGVSILSRMGVGTLAFGSETGDASLLRRAAETADTDAFRARAADLVRAEIGPAAAYTKAMREALTENARSEGDTDAPATLPEGFPAPNDRLAVAYLRALGRTNGERAARGLPPTDVLTVRREGQSYDDVLLTNAAAPSATALRVLLREAADDPDALDAMLDGTMPDEALRLLSDAVRAGQAPADSRRLLPFLHAHIRLCDPDTLSGIAELSGGLSDRMIRAARETTDGDAFLSALHSRLYTDARLARGLLYAAVGVTPEDVSAAPAWTTLLAASDRGCRFLRAYGKRADAPADPGSAADPCTPIPIVTKPADAPAGRQRALAERADALWTLTLPVPTDAAALWRRRPVIRR